MCGIAGFCKKDVTVTLTGDGGDELFCGYSRYKKYNRRWNEIKHIPFEIRRVMSKMISGGYYSKKNILIPSCCYSGGYIQSQLQCWTYQVLNAG